MRKIASYKKYKLKIAALNNYFNIGEKISTAGPGVIVSGPYAGRVTVPGPSAPEDEAVEEATKEREYASSSDIDWPETTSEQASKEGPAISSQEPVSFEEEDRIGPLVEELLSLEELKDQFGAYTEETPSVEIETLTPEYWRDRWERQVRDYEAAGSDRMTRNYPQGVDEYIKKNIEKERDYYEIDPMSHEEFTSKYKEDREAWEKELEAKEKRGDPRTDPDEWFDPIYSLLNQTVGRMSDMYEEGDRPPAVSKMTRLVANRDYGKIITHFSRLWTDLVQYHRDKGIELQPQVTHNFRTIEMIVRNL